MIQVLVRVFIYIPIWIHVGSSNLGQLPCGGVEAVGVVQDGPRTELNPASADVGVVSIPSET